MTNPDFALKWLDFLGNKLFNKGKQIFLYDGKGSYEINPYGMLDTKIRYGQRLWDEEEEHQENYTKMSGIELDNLGFAIKSDNNPDYFWKPLQKCYYYVIRKTKNSVGLSYGSFRKACQQTNMIVEHDALRRRFRLKGDSVLAATDLRIDSGVSDWVYYDKDSPKQIIPRKSVQLSKDEIRAQMRQRLYGEQIAPEFEYQQINEVPMIITPDKHIVCIAKQDICQRMIVVGMSRKGKSIFTNAVSGRVFYQWQDRVAWLIDPLNQFHNLSLPQEYSEYNKVNLWINNHPTPIPAVQLYLASRYPSQIIHKNISLLITLNFEEFIRKIQFYTFGIKEYDLGGTRRYLVDFVKEIKNITAADELRDIMFDKIPNAHKDKGLQSMIYKWVNTFETIFKEGFISNLYKGESIATDRLEVEFKDGNRMSGHPFIICYEAGLVPVLNISSARRQRWIRNYLADLMQKIVANQIEMGKNQRRVWIIADELNEIYELGKKRDNASASFEELYRQGGINNIGFIGNTQSLDKLNPEMYKNATHICCVTIQDGKERKKIGEIFNVEREVYDQLGELQPQEMMIFSKEPFTIYDRWGRKKISEPNRTWYRGRIIPPFNYHKLPPKGG